MDYDLFAVQGGLDIYQVDRADSSSDMAGFYGAIGTGHGNTEFFGNGLGSNSLNAFTFGGYWTHYGPQGWYVDALLQGTRYNIDADSNRPFSLSTNGTGFGASFETGYPFPLASGWIIEPQAQLSYQSIALDDANDGTATISFSNVDNLLGRVGARLAKSWELAPGEANPRLITGWLRASYTYQFLEKPNTIFTSATGPVPFEGDFSGSSVILNAGLDADLRDDVSFYANVDYEYQFGDLGQSIGCQIGLKVKW
ncbi:autotransporter outer membrane beta-barrel domain-containing protein [Ochrobactrum sp. RH2CCR150]|uniref:autotransporter domain-containing protein n=1 Tax=Ochrobactrum sp. RH2CCR150 TaxID=2587044 RepID=UPI0015FC8050|nr:outer membrane autotransporter protein [Ochrobactrum sp. RH2CCR150]